MGKKWNKDRKPSKKLTSKRNFLKYLVGGAVVAGLGAGGYLLIPRTPELSFLDRAEIGDSVRESLEEVKEKYCPIGLPKNLLNSSREYTTIEEMLLKKINNSSDKTTRFNFKVIQREYLLPDSSQYAEDAKEYCKIGEEFLHQNVKNIDIPKLEWKKVKSKDSFDVNFNKIGFVGRGYYYVCEGQHSPVGSSNWNFSGGTWQLREGAALEMYSNDGTPGAGSIFALISANRTALPAPFSELLPLARNEKHNVLGNTFGHLEMTAEGEAFSEAMSYHLMTRILKEKFGFNIKKIESVVGTYYDEKIFKQPRYKYVKVAIDLTGKIGVQETFDWHMRDPVGYVRKLNEMRYAEQKK